MMFVQASELAVGVVEVLVVVAFALLDALGALEVAAGSEAFLKFKLAPRPLPLLINAELELVLLLLDQLLGYLLLLEMLSLELLVFLIGGYVVDGTIIIHPHEAVVDEVLDLALEVDLLLQPLLQPQVLRRHLGPLRQELLHLLALELFKCSVLLDLLLASSPFGGLLEEVVAVALADCVQEKKISTR